MHGSISDEVVKNLNKLTNSSQTNKFRKAFNNLSTNHKNEYIEYVKAKPKGSSAMASILNVLEKEETLKIFKELLLKDKESAFNIIDRIALLSTFLFKTLFGELDKNEYIKHVKEKPKNSSAMASILNVLEKEETLKIFKELLLKDKESAFNILDCIALLSTFLFKTLFDQLNAQQKEEYRVHLKTKSTAKAKYTLREFYLNNKESVNNLSTENSNEPLVQNRDDLPAAHFSLRGCPETSKLRHIPSVT